VQLLRALAHIVDAICLARRTRVPRFAVFPRISKLYDGATEMARTLHKPLTPDAVRISSSGRRDSPRALALQEEQHELHDP
jgi:hypothetical protein